MGVTINNYRALVPEDTFLGHYMQLCDGIETAEAYDFWCGLWVLGTVLGRGVYIPRPRAPVFMNWYVMLVANSGLTRKSTAVGIARDIVSPLIPGLIEGRASASKIVERLSEHPHTAIVVSELVTLLGKEHFMMEIPGLLTDLYDCPKERRGGGTVFMGTRDLIEPYLTFLSASTPSWLQGAVNPAVIEGGFTSRTMFIYADEPKKRVAWPSEATMDTDWLVNTLLDTCHYAQQAGRIEMYPSGLKKYEQWYRKRPAASLDPFLSSFHSREDSHLLRIAACLAVNDRSYAIDNRHINTAIRVLRHVRLGATELFSGGTSINRVTIGINRICELLTEAGPAGVGHTQLYLKVRNYMSGDLFRATMQIMIEGHMVVGMQNRTGGRGKVGVRYCRGPKIHHHPALASVRDAILGADA